MLLCEPYFLEVNTLIEQSGGKTSNVKTFLKNVQINSFFLGIIVHQLGQVSDTASACLTKDHCDDLQLDSPL